LFKKERISKDYNLDVYHFFSFKKIIIKNIYVVFEKKKLKKKRKKIGNEKFGKNEKKKS